MSRFALLFTFLCFANSSVPFLVDPSADGKHVYDGHGALSAGASSRLLYDYEEPMRSEIMDYLYKPKFGASLHHVKVEIGGDSQSTDGTEASHMHRRDDLNCHRGYEWWLLEEARKRNPDVVTHALSWAVPEWVGNDTYYSTDNIDYHISWLKCAKEEHVGIGNIDYMGIWNERSWGNPSWVKKLRAAMDAEGFVSTKLVLPDGGFDRAILTDIDADPDFGKALEGGAIGLHYPCNAPQPDVQSKYHLKYWSSEDYSTEANWAGAGCWGRILNTNFVRMNMTSTISWSLIWSVYDDFTYFGNGLMYAYWPWSGYYTVNGAIWTSAHYCQFTDPGWFYIGGTGRGTLSLGGSYVALADPSGQEVTIVIEKLHGKCLRCPGQTTSAEMVQLQLAGALRRHASLAVWSTNETHQFVRLADALVQPTSGLITITVAPDSIITLSSTSGQQKGSFPTVPTDTPFPFPYKDNFEQRLPPQPATFFADNGGSFEIMEDPLRQGNLVLGQVVAPPPIKNSWTPNMEPITILGDKSWGKSLRVSADVLLPRPSSLLSSRAYVGVCIRVRNGARGHCFSMHADGSWHLSEDGSLLSFGKVNFTKLGTWQPIAIEGDGVVLRGIWAGQCLGSTNVSNSPTGRVALITGWNQAYFDNFEVGQLPSTSAACHSPSPTPGSWTDLGAGCCTTIMQQRSNAMYDGMLKGGLASCKMYCAAMDGCGYITYGWPKSDWCMAWSDKVGCGTLDAGGLGHCGSTGNTGVHSYSRGTVVTVV